MRGRVTCLGVLVGVLALGAGPAVATTYCVGLPDTCAPADNRSSLEAALSSAAAGAGSDQVLLGPGTFTAAFSSGFDYSAADPVEIIGRGASQTIVTAAAALTAGEAVLSLSGHPDSAVRNLAVTVPATAGAADGIALSAGTASGVEVGGASTTQVRRGIVQTGGLVRSSRAAAPGSNAASVAVVNTDGATDDVEVRGTTGITLSGTTSTKRLHAIANGSAGISASGAGTHTISQSEIRNAGSYGIRLSSTTGQAQSVSVTDTTLSANGSYGVFSDQSSASTLTIDGANIVNHSYGVYRASTSSMSVTYSNVWNNGVNYTSVLAGTGTISQNPQFISATDLRPQGSSPLIDAGNPSAAAAAQDAGGRTRDVDGNGDGTVRRDIGAHEYQRAAPVVTASATPAQPAPGETVTFSSTATDPDGDATIIGWTFSDGSVASTASVQKVFTAPGTYTGTVMVTDSTGRSGTAQASVTIPAPPAAEEPKPPATTTDGASGGGGQTPATTTPTTTSPPATSPPPGEVPAAADVLAPRLSALSLPKALRVGKAVPAPNPTGALRFTLSEAATVKISFARLERTAGRTRFVRVPGAVTIAGRAGQNRIRFSGRLTRTKALKPGKYRMTVSAVDAAGNRGAAATRAFVVRAA